MVARLRGALLALLIGWPPAADAQRAVSVELLLAIDVSASVDDAEFRLQTGGIAAAFRRADLVSLIERHPGGIAVAVMQWSAWPDRPGPEDWFMVSGAASAAAFAASVEGMERAALGSRTAVGGALLGGAEALSANGIAAVRQVIDLSGDGRSNAGPEPVTGQRAAISRGITVNGLAVLTDDGGLDSYYRRWVVAGPGAFVAAIEDYRDFGPAMAAKLLRELAFLPGLSELDSGAH